MQGDARDLPFQSGTFDGVTAISALEHVEGLHGDRDALIEAARVLGPGGRALVTVPFRAAGSLMELDEQFTFWQRQFSATTLEDSFIAPSGLHETERIYYGERLPFYALARRLPKPLDWLRRPWDTALTAALLRPTSDPFKASAVFLSLAKHCGEPPGQPGGEGHLRSTSHY